MSSSAMLEWKFSQVFGEQSPGEKVDDADLISAVEFESRGDYLATGDHGECKVKRVKEMEPSPNVSLENALLSEKSFVTRLNESSVQNGYHLEWINKKPRSVSPTPEEGPNMIFNVVESAVARCQRAYAHAHDYNINSISNNSNGETFISADELRINLWNLEVSNQCFNIVDLKPLDLEDLIAYSSSRGFIQLVDMRQSALCDQNAKILLDREAHGSRSFFAEIIASISDIKFAKNGRHILSQDYMNLKLWDLHMESSPIAIFKINEYPRPKLPVLYNHDAIFDKFDCCISRDGHHLASGSYSKIFKVFSHDGGQDDGITLEATRNPNRPNNHSSMSMDLRFIIFSYINLKYNKLIKFEELAKKL
ncbi:Serine/threonine-protein phosphatase 2A 55 kDa regulatory subunit B [Cocos nucifera]|uniref:Serine/threonine-protein phosphatase 2A 55 kDa regulatory subunit B n=1 Tax=Cocos nucifera TaxID=13894 RepID=A0A8K0IA66_COCNU|nr:Serine/threonine-protein phosphatase 2A 55 kDa regulatory subunit B [Cocos nucifera]